MFTNQLSRKIQSFLKISRLLKREEKKETAEVPVPYVDSLEMVQKCTKSLK
jgi:hypothetical protein